MIETTDSPSCDEDVLSTVPIEVPYLICFRFNCELMRLISSFVFLDLFVIQRLRRPR